MAKAVQIISVVAFEPCYPPGKTLCFLIVVFFLFLNFCFPLKMILTS